MKLKRSSDAICARPKIAQPLCLRTLPTAPHRSLASRNGSLRHRERRVPALAEHVGKAAELGIVKGERLQRWRSYSWNARSSLRRFLLCASRKQTMGNAVGGEMLAVDRSGFWKHSLPLTTTLQQACRLFSL